MECYRTLSNGIQIPRIGFGCCFGSWRIPNEEIVENAVYTAIRNGYRLIDSAPAYKNEVYVGNAIKKSNINRKELFVSSKLWNTERGYENTLAAFEKTLIDLQLDYLDLYLIHWPVPVMFRDSYIEKNRETWRAFETLYRQGKVKAIGVSNFLPHHIKEIEETAEIFPMVNQIEFHPGCMQNEVVSYCNENNILVQGYSPLGTGKVFKISDFECIAQKYQKSVAQICLRWCLQKGIIPLPKSANLERIKKNIEIFDFELYDEDVMFIDGITSIKNTENDPDHINF